MDILHILCFTVLSLFVSKHKLATNRCPLILQKAGQILIYPFISPVFYHSFSSQPDDVTIMVGGVKLQVVHGDIVTETVDVIVNSTDFTTDYKGMY